MNPVVTIARNDLADVFRSRMVWGATVLMTALVGISWLSLGTEFVDRVDTPLLTAVESFSLWVPLVGIVLGYAVVVGERESGRIRILLGLPSTRRDLVVGKYLSRAAVLLTALALSLGVLFLLVSIRVDSVDFLPLFSSALLLVLYGLAWLGMSLGVSSIVSSKTRAVATVVGVYALFGPLWHQIALPVCALVVTGSAETPALTGTLTYAEDPTWYLYAVRLSPFEAFDGARYYLRDLLEIAVAGGQTTALHAPNLFGLAVLLCWAIVPVGIGSQVFERADLE